MGKLQTRGQKNLTTTLLLSPYSIADDAPNRQVEEISRELGVSSDKFRVCFKNVKPDKEKNPNSQTQIDNKKILLPCLQKANPSLNNTKLDFVMDKYRR